MIRGILIDPAGVLFLPGNGVEPPRAEVRLALGCLQRRGYRLGLVAEGTVREQAARLAATRLTEFWDATVITEAHGAAALDRDLFACALACLDLTAEETVFVGAGPAAGFAAARQVGLAAFWIGETGLRPPPHTTVHVGGLGELADALDLMEGRRAAS